MHKFYSNQVQQFTYMHKIFICFNKLNWVLISFYKFEQILCVIFILILQQKFKQSKQKINLIKMNNQINHSHKFNELHQFLDEQIKKNHIDQRMIQTNGNVNKYHDSNMQKNYEQTVYKNNNQNNKFGDFDIIQDKLKSLQVRLQKMNKQNNSIKKFMPKSKQQQEIYQDQQFLNDLKEIVKQRKSSVKKVKPFQSDKRQAQVYAVKQLTPARQKLSQKTKSEAVIKTVCQQAYSMPLTMSMKKNQSKNFKQQKSQTKKSSRCSTAKKTYKQNNVITSATNPHQSQNKKQQQYQYHALGWSVARKQSLQKINPTVSVKQIRFLQRELKDFAKQNITLKNRISQLKGYEVQYWKMKDIFQKSQKLRKKQKILVFKK